MDRILLKTEKQIFICHTENYIEKLLSFIEKYANNSCDIIELGGGNSCFAQDLVDKCKVNIESYSIVDNCSVAVERFIMMRLSGEAYLADLTSDSVLTEIDKEYDVVFSVGLIEHFRGLDIEKIIANHFQLCKTGGMVLISVPTPTVQYCFIRKCMEILKVWQFPDEKPIQSLYNQQQRNGIDH